MNIRGAIYYKSAFKFHNGSVFDKLVVLLNTPLKNDDYLFVPTTSQKKDTFRYSWLCKALWRRGVLYP